MSAKTDLKAIKKKMGLHKKEQINAFAHSYNDNDEILFDVCPYGSETDVTEEEIRELYPESHYKLNLIAKGVSDGKGGHRLDEKGRREIVDFRGV